MDSTESKPLKKKVKKEKLENNDVDQNRHKSKKVEGENQREDPRMVKISNTMKNEVDSDSSEDGETECAAKYCRCPSDEQVAWVQCDKCQQWFHILCVGLTHQAAEAMDVFVCVDCITIGHANVNATVECPKNAEIRICSTS